MRHRRQRRFALEALENRELLSGLSFSLTTDKPVYDVGQTVTITLTETNTGDQPLTVPVVPTEFTVRGSDGSFWQSNPTNAGQPPTSVTLQPGQSISQSATWDGTTPSTLFGSQYTLTDWGTFQVSSSTGPQGLTDTFQINSPLSSGVTTDQSAYEIGQPVHLTYTETNTATVPITFEYLASGGNQFSVTHDGVTWNQVFIEPQVVGRTIATWAPGYGITISYTWDALPSFPPPSTITGTFIASYGPLYSDHNPSTSFEILPPPAGALQTSVTTDHASYILGEPVNMTFTETNVSDQPIVAPTGWPWLEISQNGSSLWDQSQGDTGPTNLTWTTLQPGQSYQQTGTWNGLPNSGQLINLSSPFTVSDQLDPLGTTTTFRYVAPSGGQLATSITADQPIYQLPQPMTFTFTETNQGTSPVQVLDGPPLFDVYQETGLVWSSAYPTSSDTSQYKWVTIQPGQSLTRTVTWNGVPDHLPATEPTGTFTVSNRLDPTGGSATFKIATLPLTHLTTTLTTDKPSYFQNDPITATFTETNNGKQPVAILEGPTFFIVTQQGQPISDSNIPWHELADQPTWKILLPGESYSQTYLWPNQGQATSGQAGTFVISNLLDSTGTTATVQVSPFSSTNPPAPTPPPGSIWFPPAVPVSPAPPPANPVSPAPVVSAPTSSPTDLVSTDKPAYKVGHAVRISVTMNSVPTDTSSNRRVSLGRITILDGSKAIWRSTLSKHALKTSGSGSGKAITLTSLWNGRPNQPSVKHIKPGTYTVEFQQAGHEASATIRIV